MNATVTIIESFDLQTKGEFVCRVEAGQTFNGTAKEQGVKFWVQDSKKTLHPAFLPLNSTLVKIERWKQ